MGSTIYQKLIDSHSRIDAGIKGAGLLPLFHPDEHFALGNEEQKIAVEKWRNERRDLHRRFCEALLDRSPYEGLALVSLCRQNEIENLPPPPDAWQRAVEIYSQPKADPPPAGTPDFAALFGSNEISYTEPMPRKTSGAPRTGAEFLVWLAGETDQQYAFVDDLIPAIHKAGRTSLATDAAEIATWHFIEEDNFAAALRRPVEQLLNETETVENLPDQFRRLEVAFEIGFEREQFDAVAAALSELLTQWCAPLASGQNEDLRQPGRIVGFAGHMLKSTVHRFGRDDEGENTVTILLPALTALATSPDPEEGRLLQFASKSGEDSAAWRQVELLLALLKAIDDLEEVPPQLYVHAWDIGQSLGEWPEDRKLRPWRTDFDRIGDRNILHPGAAVRHLVNRSTFLGKWEEFDMVSKNFGKHSKATSMYERLVERMRLNEDNYKYYRAWLQREAGDDFGAKLTKALLTPPKKAVDAEMISPLLPELLRLPHNQQGQLANYSDQQISRRQRLIC